MANRFQTGIFIDKYWSQALEYYCLLTPRALSILSQFAVKEIMRFLFVHFTFDLFGELYGQRGFFLILLHFIFFILRIDTLANFKQVQYDRIAGDIISCKLLIKIHSTFLSTDSTRTKTKLVLRNFQNHRVKIHYSTLLSTSKIKAKPKLVQITKNVQLRQRTFFYLLTK